MSLRVKPYIPYAAEVYYDVVIQIHNHEQLIISSLCLKNFIKLNRGVKNMSDEVLKLPYMGQIRYIWPWTKQQ